MCHDVPSDWFLGVSVEHGAPVHLSDHLVGHHHGHTELVRELEERPEELGEVHLPGGELPTAAVVGPVAGGGAVHHHHGVPGLRHHGGRLGQQSHLVVAVVGPGVGHVVQDVTALQSVSLSHGQQPEEKIIERCSGVMVSNLSGLKVPSVSMYKHFPSAPPLSMGS